MLVLWRHPSLQEKHVQIDLVLLRLTVVSGQCFAHGRCWLNFHKFLSP